VVQELTWLIELSMFVLIIPYQLPCWSFLEFPKGVFWDPYCLLYIWMIYHHILLSRSERWDMYFNLMKSIHLHINAKAITEYRIAGTNIVTKSVHKDLGNVMSDDLSWNHPYEKIIPKAYRMLELLQSVSICKRTLYLSLVRFQVTYCSIIWRPTLIKHITLVERIQRRATKFINDYTSSYFDRLKKFNL